MLGDRFKRRRAAGKREPATRREFDTYRDERILVFDKDGNVVFETSRREVDAALKRAATAGDAA
ncbi:MAG: hypothetical protein AAFX81_05370 [Pseudomonadota bacterium]